MFLLLRSASLIIAIFGFSPGFSNEREIAGAVSSSISNSPNPTTSKTDILGIPGISVHPTSTLTPSQTPSPTPISPNKSASDLLQQINIFRSGKNLAALSANSETCFFANLRSQEIISNFNHDGFRNRIDSNSLPYPSYSLVTENIAMNSDPNQVVPGWINSPGHAENLLKDAPFGCVVGNGDYYVFEAWSP